MAEREDFSTVKAYFNSKGVTLLSTEYKKSRSPLYFECKDCGKEWHITWAAVLRGENPELLCRACRAAALKKEGVSFNQAVIKKFDTDKLSLDIPEIPLDVASIQSNIEEEKPKKKSKPSKPQQTKPKEKISHSTRSKIKEPLDISLDRIKMIVESTGAHVLSTSYVDASKTLNFSCSRCGADAGLTWQDHLKGKNPDFMCNSCLAEIDPTSTYADQHYRESIPYTYQIFDSLEQVPPTSYYFNLLLHEFYNLGDDWDFLPISDDPMLQTSIGNFYPVPKDKKDSSYLKFLISSGPSEWSDSLKLPYHTYNDFTWPNINEGFVSEVWGLEKETSNIHFLYDRKKDFAEKGILYFPIYVEEIEQPQKRKILCSMMRHRIARFFPQIFEFTGVQHRRFYSRSLVLKELNWTETKDFFDECHIQGKIPAVKYFGLLTKQGELVACMSFGHPRNKRYEYEILRYATKPNTSVTGGVSRCFKAFVKAYNPKSVLSFTDVRESNFNREDPVYCNILGFSFMNYSAPNYKYLDFPMKTNLPYTWRLFTRNRFQRHKLYKNCLLYKADGTETQITIDLNGYPQVFDCGNYVFGWENPNYISPAEISQ